MPGFQNVNLTISIWAETVRRSVPTMKLRTVFVGGASSCGEVGFRQPPFPLPAQDLTFSFRSEAFGDVELLIPDAI